MYNYWDEEARARFPDRVVNIKMQKEWQQEQDAVALTDTSVAVILNGEKRGTDPNSTTTAPNSGGDAVKILSTIDKLGSSSKGGKPLSPKLKDLEDVAIAIELLMITRRSQQGNTSHSAPILTLEQFVRKRCPELTLYASDEQYKGESVESQLQGARWQGPDISVATDRWKRLHKIETHRTWRNRAIFVAKGAVTGLLLSVVGILLQGTR